MRFSLLIIFIFGTLYAQKYSSTSKAYISYAAEVITYRVVENENYPAAAGAIPDPSPFVLNYLEFGYCSFNEELMLGIYGGLSLGQPTGSLKLTKADINFELGLHGGSLDFYVGLKGFVLINLKQKGVSISNLSDVNISYKNGQIYGYATDIGIRAFITRKLLISIEGAINFYTDGNSYDQWYTTGAVAPFKTVIIEKFTLKGGFGIAF